MNIRYIIGMLNKNRYYSVLSKIGNNHKKGNIQKNKNKKSSKTISKTKNLGIDANNMYVKSMIDDVLDDITQERGTIDINNNICTWWSTVVSNDNQLRQKILRRMTEVAIRVVSECQ